MLAKQTTTLIGTFYCLDWNPKQSVSDIFLFYTQINKQPAKRARQEIEKTKSLYAQKTEYPNIVEKLNSRRIAYSKRMCFVVNETMLYNNSLPRSG